jgi:hypothetical protein
VSRAPYNLSTKRESPERGKILGMGHETPVWVPIAVALITSIPATFAAVVSLMNHDKISKLEVSVDGRLTNLLELTAKSSRAEGAKQEKDNPTT